MELKLIELKNIRSHTHYVFEPIRSGITVISGENGKGKSTILDSFAWCLFGTRLHGLRNKLYIKDGVNPKTSEVSVRVVLTIQNKDYQIKRTIVNDKGSSECVVSYKNTSEENFTFICGPSITVSEQYIRELLKGTDKSFFLSTFIKQKEVDKILDISLSERSKILDELIGITAIQNSISKVKEESKSLNKALSVLKVEDSSELKETLKIHKDEYKNLTRLLTDQITEIEQMKNSLSEETENLSINKTIQTTFLELRSKENEVNSKIELLSEQLSKQLDLSRNYKDVKYEDKTFKYQQQKQNSLLDSIQSVKTDIELKNREYGTLSQLFSLELTEETKVLYEKALSESKENDNRTNFLEFEINKNREEIENLKVLIQSIKDGNAECPVCKNPISDKCLEEYKNKGKSLILQNKEYESELERKKSKSNFLLEETIKRKKDYDLFVELESKKEDFANLKFEILELRSKLEIQETEKSVVDSDITRLSEQKQLSDEYKLIKHNIKGLNEDIGELNKEKNIIQSELSKYSDFSLSRIEKQEKTVLELTNLISNKEIEKVKIESEINILKEKIKNVLNEIKRIEEVSLKFTEVSNLLDNYNNAHTVLSDFKETRIKESIPVITDITSTIISKITDGKIDKIEISPKFEINVIMDSGRSRDIEALSGGEKSSVAIALRLAISLFLRGNEKGLIILDEVLVSLSDYRANLVLDIIRSITDSQIIMISHSSIINSVADKIVTL